MVVQQPVTILVLSQEEMNTHTFALPSSKHSLEVSVCIFNVSDYQFLNFTLQKTLLREQKDKLQIGENICKTHIW